MDIEKREYYDISESASRQKDHPATLAISEAAEASQRILDLGCGEGTRLGLLRTNGDRYGVDISEYAVGRAKKKYPKVKFYQGDITKLPFKSIFFDLVYSMFVLEHVRQPEELLKEAVRVLKKRGTLIIGAPNFGSPNRRSPNSKEGKISKLIKGLSVPGTYGLSWKQVEPRRGKYFIDADTVVEPNMISLIKYLRHLGLTIVHASSLWEIDEFSLKQLLFRILGRLKVYPFTYWGPQIFVTAKK